MTTTTTTATTTTASSAAAGMPNYRRRALAGLDELIARTEAVRARWLAGGPGRPGAMVRFADERLAVLRASRLALIADDGRVAKGRGREPSPT